MPEAIDLRINKYIYLNWKVRLDKDCNSKVNIGNQLNKHVNRDY